MAWTSPPTFTNAVLTAAQMNILSADLNETAAAKSTQSSSIFVGAGTNQIQERLPTEANEFAIETSTSTSYTNLATVGPNCTLTTGPHALVGSSAIMYNNTAGAQTWTSMAVYTPPSTSQVAADDNWGALVKCEATPNGAANGAFTRMHMFYGLISQSNLFQLKYRVSAGTGTWDERSTLVVPL
jgi:hypothetical protein